MNIFRLSAWYPWSLSRILCMGLLIIIVMRKFFFLVTSLITGCLLQSRRANHFSIGPLIIHGSLIVRFLSSVPDSVNNKDNHRNTNCYQKTTGGWGSQKEHNGDQPE